MSQKLISEGTTRAFLDNINDNFDELYTNHIVAQGKIGFWNYRKWKDGYLECWCRRTHSMQTNREWVGDSRINYFFVSGNDGSNNDDVYLEFPFEFNEIPFISCSLISEDKSVIALSINAKTVSQDGFVLPQVASPFRSSVYVTFNISVKGYIYTGGDGA